MGSTFPIMQPDSVSPRVYKVAEAALGPLDLDGHETKETKDVRQPALLAHQQTRGFTVTLLRKLIFQSSC